MRAIESGAALYVLGDARSAMIPAVLRPYASDRSDGDISVNLLVNCGWEWDLYGAAKRRKETLEMLRRNVRPLPLPYRR